MSTTIEEQRKGMIQDVLAMAERAEDRKLFCVERFTSFEEYKRIVAFGYECSAFAYELAQRY